MLLMFNSKVLFSIFVLQDIMLRAQQPAPSALSTLGMMEPQVHGVIVVQVERYLMQVQQAPVIALLQVAVLDPTC